jgi:hypothetical protein
VLASLRTDRFAGVALACVLLASCMRIYTDPELPDVEVSWYADSCEDAGVVVVALVGLDDGSRVEVTSACTGPEILFEDVQRARYRIEATLFDAAGNASLQAAEDADLRDGLDEQIDLYFSSYSSFRVAWVFDMGASCASLAVDAIALELLPDGERLVYSDCRRTPTFGFHRNGTYTMQLRALSGSETVAIAPESAPFTLAPLEQAELGTMTLSPCAPSCPGP